MCRVIERKNQLRDLKKDRSMILITYEVFSCNTWNIFALLLLRKSQILIFKWSDFGHLRRLVTKLFIVTEMKASLSKTNFSEPSTS